VSCRWKFCVLSSYRLALLYFFFLGYRPFCALRVMKFRVLVAWEDVTSRQVKRRAARGFWCSRTGVPCFAACRELVHMTERSRKNRAALTAVALWAHSEGTWIESGVPAQNLNRGLLVFPRECWTSKGPSAPPHPPPTKSSTLTLTAEFLFGFHAAFTFDGQYSCIEFWRVQDYFFARRRD